MSDSYLDHVPSQEREKIRRRMRSPEAYEKLRERVKGPEDLEREMEKNDAMAEMHFALESDHQFHEQLKSKVEGELKEKGVENVLEFSTLSPEARKSLESGKFVLRISANPKTHIDQLVAVPEGNVQEKLPVKPALSQQYLSQLRRKE